MLRFEIRIIGPGSDRSSGIQIYGCLLERGPIYINYSFQGTEVIDKSLVLLPVH